MPPRPKPLPDDSGARALQLHPSFVTHARERLMGEGSSGGWRLLRFVSNNLLTLAAVAMLQDIAGEYRSADTICVQGTRLRALRQLDSAYRTAYLLHAGHGEGSNRVCGIAIGLHKSRSPLEYVVQVTAGRGVLQGRALMVRCRRGRQDMAALSLCFPARGTGRGAVQKQRDTCLAMVQWSSST